jgi:hypothetical protein
MNMNFEQPQKKYETERARKPLVEVMGKVFGQDIRVTIEGKEGSFGTKYDRTRKTLDINITTENIKNGKQAVSDFLNSPQFQSELDSFKEYLRESIERKKLERKQREEKKAIETIEKYNQQKEAGESAGVVKRFFRFLAGK